MTGCPVRPGHVCAEKDRKLAKLSYLPDCDPTPGTQPSVSPHRPPGFLGGEVPSSSYPSSSSCAGVEHSFHRVTGFLGTGLLPPPFGSWSRSINGSSVFNDPYGLSKFHTHENAPAQLPVIPGTDLAIRRDYVKKGGGAIFKIEGNSSAKSAAPLYEIGAVTTVNYVPTIINTTAKKWGLDPDLIRAVMYIEETHGYYDFITQPFGLNHTILPMNVHDKLWGKEFAGTREQLSSDPAHNIDVGAKILAGIRANLAPEDRTVEKIATLYNMLGATKVTDYGARVNAIYIGKPWIKSQLQMDGSLPVKSKQQPSNKK